MIQRSLCSHIVQVFLPDDSRPAENALLEEIGPTSFVLTTEREYHVGANIVLAAEEWVAPAMVRGTVRRDDDFTVHGEFTEGFVWDPAVWTPKHLYRPTTKGRARGSSG